MLAPTPSSPSQKLVNIPPATAIILVVITLVQLVRVFVLNDQDDALWIVHLGFVPLALKEADLHSIWPWSTLVTYSLLHFGWTHFFVNATGMMAFGSAVERTVGVKRYLVVLLIGIIAGALTHFVFFSNSTILLGGISAGISALFAVIIGMMQQHQRGWRGMAAPVIVWLLMNVVIGLMGMPGQPGLAIAWVAHLGGFVAALVCLPVLFPAYRFWHK